MVVSAREEWPPTQPEVRGGKQPKCALAGGACSRMAQLGRTRERAILFATASRVGRVALIYRRRRPQPRTP